MEHKYLNDYHKQSSEAAQKEVEEMAKHPLSAEEKIAQCLRNNERLSQRVLGENKEG